MGQGSWSPPCDHHLTSNYSLLSLSASPNGCGDGPSLRLSISYHFQFEKLKFLEVSFTWTLVLGLFEPLCTAHLHSRQCPGLVQSYCNSWPWELSKDHNDLSRQYDTSTFHIQTRNFEKVSRESIGWSNHFDKLEKLQIFSLSASDSSLWPDWRASWLAA